MYENNRKNYNALKTNYKQYLKESEKIGDFFGGPSLYFHNRALEEREKNFLGDTHIEMIYAALAAWGMHRMGETKAKMADFEEFKKSILEHKETFLELKELRIEEIKVDDLESVINKINKICSNLKSSISNSSLVGNSKTIAHILPNLVPPIDRQYTIRFFKTEPSKFLNKKGKFKPVPNFKSNEENEYFKYIMYKTYDFIKHIKSDPEIKIEKPFNTSLPKIFDNLIVTYVRSVRENEIKNIAHNSTTKN